MIGEEQAYNQAITWLRKMLPDGGLLLEIPTLCTSDNAWWVGVRVQVKGGGTVPIGPIAVDCKDGHVIFPSATLARLQYHLAKARGETPCDM